MSDYVPSVGAARARYCDSIVRKDGVPHSFVVTPEDHAKNHAEFDRMIAEVRRQAAEEAYERGRLDERHDCNLTTAFERGEMTRDELQANLRNPYTTP